MATVCLFFQQKGGKKAAFRAAGEREG